MNNFPGASVIFLAGWSYATLSVRCQVYIHVVSFLMRKLKSTNKYVSAGLHCLCESKGWRRTSLSFPPQTLAATLGKKKVKRGKWPNLMLKWIRYKGEQGHVPGASLEHKYLKKTAWVMTGRNIEMPYRYVSLAMSLCFSLCDIRFFFHIQQWRNLLAFSC